MEQYSREEILNIVEEEDVEFIRLQFTDMFGTMKNIAIPAGKLPKAMDDRCIIDASSIEGFIRTEESEMYLRPDLTTFSILPWRPQQGKVALPHFLRHAPLAAHRTGLYEARRP